MKANSDPTNPSHYFLLLVLRRLVFYCGCGFGKTGSTSGFSCFQRRVSFARSFLRWKKIVVVVAPSNKQNGRLRSIDDDVKSSGFLCCILDAVNGESNPHFICEEFCFVHSGVIQYIQLRTELQENWEISSSSQ